MEKGQTVIFQPNPPSRERLEGTVKQVKGDQLVITSGGRTHTVPADRVVARGGPVVQP